MIGLPVPALHGRTGCADCMNDTLRLLVPGLEDVAVEEGCAGQLVLQNAHIPNGLVAAYEVEG